MIVDLVRIQEIQGREPISDGYNDVKAAAGEAYKEIWGGWLFAGIVAVAVVWFTDDDSVVGIIADFTAKWGWIPSTLIALVLCGRVSDREKEARKRALGR
ncbi:MULTISPECIES: hypothetical protein [Streptomyces]|uniref:Uncharacterized protein n=1 Tax=Streptomyces griseocarneus TaxID=51201 RepID=A0ABX7RR27_9ACTN|nr:MULTISPECIES: hypothetical protein [Streptomyces]QSY49906.1 hypothetical protein J3S04_02095 [Streptomyces griseocarneus]